MLQWKMMVYQFEQFVKEKNGKYSDFPFCKYHDQLKFSIKQKLAHISWGDEACHYIKLTNDSQIQQAMQLFDQADQLLAKLRFKPTSDE